MLGKKVRDKITGFEGIVTGRAEYLSGCIQCCVKPKMSEGGKMPEGEWIDEGQLEIIEEMSSLEKKEKRGGPVADVPPKN